MKFIHCSDLHLDSPLDGLERYPGAPVDDLRGATRQAMRALVRLAVEQAVDFVVIAGDVFDGEWRDMNTGLFFHAEMSTLARAGIPVYLKKGNHDAASEITRTLPLPANVHEFDAARAQTFRIDPLRVALHGRSFASRAVPEDLVGQYPPPLPGWFNVGVLHTSLGGYAAHDPYAPTSLDALRGKGYDYWALGHVHAREVLQEAHPRIVYCGNLQGRHAGEPGAKGCELVTVEDGQVSAEFVALDVVRWAHVEVPIDGLQSDAEFWTSAERAVAAAHARAGGRMSALRVAVVGAGPLHGALAADPDEFGARVRALANDACAGRAWVEKVQLRTSAGIVPGAAGSPGEPPLAVPDDPLGQCLRSAAQLQADPQALSAFAGQSLRELIAKLPAELRGAGGAGFEDPAGQAQLLREAEALLLARLAGQAPA